MAFRPISHQISTSDRLDALDAAANTALARTVADHKSVFFVEKNPQGGTISYHAAVTGALQLIPAAGALDKLAADYRQMVDDGLFLDEPEPFDVLLERYQAVQQKANV